MNEALIRQLDLKNKEDLALYFRLKALFISEIKSDNPDVEEYISQIHKGQKVKELMFTSKLLHPFYKPSEDVYVLEILDASTCGNGGRKAIAYVSIFRDVPKDHICIKYVDKAKTMVINNFFVLPEYRLNIETLTFLKFAIKQSAGQDKQTVLFNVLSTNPNRFFHFALADNIIASYRAWNAKNAFIDMYYLYTANVSKIYNQDLKELLARAVALQHENTLEGIDVPISIVPQFNGEEINSEADI